ncbi:hypothetical protein NN3_20110 [Nocardia neocaledoniensis NBRC 108232]|nr:hypothetical protein NN3_20110 [Nocardia neocaledoniensis NBRC 108232]
MSDVSRRQLERTESFMLYRTDVATRSVVEAARKGAFDLVTTAPPQVVINGRELLDEGPGVDRPRYGRRVPWQRLAVQRLLSTCESPMTQQDLVRATGATQQAVSVTTKTLNHTTRTRHGWTGTGDLLDDWNADYPGPRGLEQHWYGLDDPADQYDTARRLLTQLDVWSVLSGDLAADQYSPWMRPSTVRLYTGDVVDFTEFGFSLTDAADATMTVVVPDDRSLLPAARYFADRQPPSRTPHLIADPAIIWWDLLQTSTDPTAVEAAQHVRATIDRRRVT